MMVAGSGSPSSNGTAVMLQKGLYSLVALLLSGVLTLAGFSVKHTLRDIDNNTESIDRVEEQLRAALMRLEQDQRLVREEQIKTTWTLEWLTARVVLLEKASELAAVGRKGDGEHQGRWLQQQYTQ